MNAHLETVPGLATLTTGSLTGGDAENLGGHASRSTSLDLFLGCLLDEIATSYNSKEIVKRERKGGQDYYLINVDEIPCSRALTLVLVRVMRMRKVFSPEDSSRPGLTCFAEATAVALMITR